MPVYDFKCQECGEVSEEFFRTVHGQQSVHCPQCGSERMEKMITASYMIRTNSPSGHGDTCCGRTERCEQPPCSTSDSCHRG